jgi:hypothetical protein
MMHPPYDYDGNAELRQALMSLRSDAFLMDKVTNHDPAYGYNSFEGFIEEDCVQALDQIISEEFGIAKDPRERWRRSDEGMHVFAVALYTLMKQDHYPTSRGETFADYLVGLIGSGRLAPGSIEKYHSEFYSN